MGAPRGAQRSLKTTKKLPAMLAVKTLNYCFISVLLNTPAVKIANLLARTTGQDETVSSAGVR